MQGVDLVHRSLLKREQAPTNLPTSAVFNVRRAHISRTWRGLSTIRTSALHSFSRSHRFSDRQRVKFLVDAQPEDAIEQYRGRARMVDHIAESTPELIFYSVALGDSWDRAYVREDTLEAVDEEGTV